MDVVESEARDIKLSESERVSQMGLNNELACLSRRGAGICGR